MRIRSLSIASCLAAVALSSSLRAQELGGGLGIKENLDLPFDAAGDNTSDEEAPEVLVFYGSQYEGDAFFYTVDRSGSMQDRGELARAKREISRNITEMADRTEFGVSFLDGGLIKFPTSGRPVEANPGMKAAALGWIAGVRGGSGSCMRLGLQTSMNFANLAQARRKVIIYVGDGGGTCHGSNETQYLQQTVAIITSQNYQRAQVNCVGVLMQGRATQKQFMIQLAQANGGTYKEIN